VSEIYTKTEAARKLKISVETINRNLKTGKLPCRKIGQRVIFTEGDLAVFLDACAVPMKGLA
jgi:excisionase family DNA binding protein